MTKMNILQAAEFFGISKEAIHNRIRRGSLESVVEEGVKYVLVDEQQATKKAKPTQMHLPYSADEKYFKFLEEQNAFLQQKLQKQEDEIRLLREQKEQILIEERQKIEQIYQQKDEQLKSILNSFKEQVLLQQAPVVETEIEESFDTEIVEKKEELISLKKFLKKQNLKPKKYEKVQKRFQKALKKGDKRLLEKKEKIYLDIGSFEYEDLLK